MNDLCNILTMKGMIYEKILAMKGIPYEKYWL